MNEQAAGQVLLLRAFETGGNARWSDADRAWATRSALQAVGADAPAEAFLAARAQAALGRLGPQVPALPRWHGGWAWGAAALGLAFGLLVDHIGSAQRINLLAPPVWAVIVWNLVVYLLLLLPLRQPGVLRRALAAWASRSRTSNTRDGGRVAVGQVFAADWATVSAPLQGARIALALHLGAAALALGLLVGMYLRGLVLDYRVGWESTFLDAGQVHALLSVLLAPALALSGQTLPDVAALQALRAPQPGASAAPWIHLYALQLALLVLLPRLLLALWAGLRARRLQLNLPLPLAEPYFQQLLRQQHGGQTPLRVWPHAHTPDAAAQAALRALCARVFGDVAALQLAPTVAYGGEESPADLPGAATRRIALFDLGATPEPESQGRLLQALGAPLMLVDESAFVQRFGADSPRRRERRQAWSALAHAAGSVAVFVELRADALSVAEAALQAALAQEATAA
jgi:hypothetical protein